MLCYQYYSLHCLCVILGHHHFEGRTSPLSPNTTEMQDNGLSHGHYQVPPCTVLGTTRQPAYARKMHKLGLQRELGVSVEA